MPRISEFQEVTPDGESLIPVVYQGVTKNSKLKNLGGAINNSELQRITNIAQTKQGWRLLGADVTYRLEVSVGSIDMTYQDGTAGLEKGGASGDYAFAVGKNTLASGEASFASGLGVSKVSVASGIASFVAGNDNVASGNGSFVNGDNCTATGHNTHAEGESTLASGKGSHSEGYKTTSSGSYSHSEGSYTTSSGINSHACGLNSTSQGAQSFTSGEGLLAQNNNQSTFGIYNDGSSAYTVFEIGNGTGDLTRSNALEVFSDGRVRVPSLDLTLVNHPRSVITKEYMEEYAGEFTQITEGTNTGIRLKRESVDSHGDIGSKAIDASHSLTTSTTLGATGDFSFAEGFETTSSGTHSHAEGYKTTSSGINSHAEGDTTTASGSFSHTEGHLNTSSGEASHSEGYNTLSSGLSSHAEGNGTIAQNEASHAEGKFNIGTAIDTIHETGIGTGDLNRKNAFEIYTDGRILAPELQATSILNVNKALISFEFLKNHLRIKRISEDYTALNLQTIFTTTTDSQYLDNIYINGVLVRSTQYTATGTQVTFDIDLYAGDWVRFDYIMLETY